MKRKVFNLVMFLAILGTSAVKAQVKDYMPPTKEDYNKAIVLNHSMIVVVNNGVGSLDMEVSHEDGFYQIMASMKIMQLYVKDGCFWFYIMTSDSDIRYYGYPDELDGKLKFPPPFESHDQVNQPFVFDKGVCEEITEILSGLGLK